MPGRGRLLVVVFIAAVTAHIKQHRTLVKTTIDHENCTVQHSQVGDEASDFPEDLFDLEQRRHGAVVLHFLGSLYCFILIAIVCNDYFLPSVDCICQDLKLSKDVAGATFMALATSAPELFVNIIGTFLTESDLGVGTVVGSDVFNTLGVAACGGLATATAIELEVWPLARDCSIFMAVVALLGLILWDGKVEWYEALTLVFLYIVYCTFLFCQKRLHTAAKSVLKSTKSFSSQLSTDTLYNRRLTLEMGHGTYKPYHHHGESLGYTERRPSYIVTTEKEIKTISATVNGKLAPPTTAPSDQSVGVECQEVVVVTEVVEEVVEWALCSPPPSLTSKLWWLLCWPISLVLTITIPDCRRTRALYPLTFIMCTVWIGLSSYFVSWMMTVIGQTFGISDSVMGLTLVAIGGSMPEASTSIINARKGIGSMSISNALGGNTLDILLSLGLPWFIKTQLPAELDGGPVYIHSASLGWNNAAQLACTAALFIAASINRFKMDRKLGAVCLVLYLLFIGFIVAVEVDVFHIKSDPPTVPCN